MFSKILFFVLHLFCVQAQYFYDPPSLLPPNPWTNLRPNSYPEFSQPPCPNLGNFGLSPPLSLPIAPTKAPALGCNCNNGPAIPKFPAPSLLPSLIQNPVPSLLPPMNTPPTTVPKSNFNLQAPKCNPPTAIAYYLPTSATRPTFPPLNSASSLPTATNPPPNPTLPPCQLPSCFNSLPPLPNSLPPCLNSLPPLPNSLPPCLNYLPSLPNSLPLSLNSLPPLPNSLPPCLNSLLPSPNSLPSSPKLLPLSSYPLPSFSFQLPPCPCQTPLPQSQLPPSPRQPPLSPPCPFCTGAAPPSNPKIQPPPTSSSVLPGIIDELPTISNRLKQPLSFDSDVLLPPAFPSPSSLPDPVSRISLPPPAPFTCPEVKAPMPPPFPIKSRYDVELLNGFLSSLGF